MIAVTLYCILILVLVAADQLAKLWAVNSLSKLGSVPVVGNIIKFTYAENTGAAFSMLEGKRILLILFPAVLTVVSLIILFSRRFKSVPLDISLALISAGGIGNLIDRIRQGYVIDFIDFNIIHFAIFNVADTCVSIGVVLLIMYLLIHEGNFGGRKSKGGIFTGRRF